jgi:hypothetical protein
MVAKKAAAAEANMIVIPRPNRTTIDVPIRSLPGSSIIFNRFSEKSMKSITDKQTKAAKTAKEAKNPQELFEASLHRVNGTYGFPAQGFKKAMVSAANIADLPMTMAKKAFFVMGDIIPFSKCSKPKMREDFPRLPNGNPDWRIRAEIDEWEAKVKILFNANYISAEQIINLVDLAGFHVGLLEMRPFAPKSSGVHGMFEVVR